MKIYKVASTITCEWCSYSIPINSHNWDDFVQQHPNGVTCKGCGGLNTISPLTSPDDLDKRFKGFSPPNPTLY